MIKTAVTTTLYNFLLNIFVFHFAGNLYKKTNKYDIAALCTAITL